MTNFFSDVMIAPPRRHAKNSVSEGELTDEVARAERVVRQRNKFISGIPGRQQQPDHGAATLNRPHRVVSGDRDRSVHIFFTYKYYFSFK